MLGSDNYVDKYYRLEGNTLYKNVLKQILYIKISIY